jgi:hypothetical protein
MITDKIPAQGGALPAPPLRNPFAIEVNPARFWNRRGRAANRAKIDKTQRNQRAVSRLRNGRKKYPDAISDMRVTAGVHSEYAIPKCLTRGAREGLKAVERDKKLQELCIDQRCRWHMRSRALQDLIVSIPAGGSASAASIYAAYNRLTPVTPRTPTGPLNSYVAKTGRYSDV